MKKDRGAEERVCERRRWGSGKSACRTCKDMYGCMIILCDGKPALVGFEQNSDMFCFILEKKKDSSFLMESKLQKAKMEGGRPVQSTERASVL